MKELPYTNGGVKERRVCCLASKTTAFWVVFCV